LAYESGMKLFDWYWRAMDAHDGRAAALAGFAGLVLAIAARAEEARTFATARPYWLCLSYCLSYVPLVCIGLSVAMAVSAWFPRRVLGLPSPLDTLGYAAEHNYNHALHMLAERLDESIVEIQKVVARKSRRVKWALVLFAVGVVSLWGPQLILRSLSLGAQLVHAIVRSLP
jgi:hypothetical protein